MIFCKVPCGIGGSWKVPSDWPDDVTGCVKTAMCTNIPKDAELPETSGIVGDRAIADKSIFYIYSEIV